MKLFTDQDVYFSTLRSLREAGHDVVTANERGLSEATDTELLDYSRVEGRVLVTRDRDYGGLVFLGSLGNGVLYLRAVPKSLGSVHKELLRVLSLYTLEELRGAFVVIEPGRHRFRRPQS